jgi:hypothetical protein
MRKYEDISHSEGSSIADTALGTCQAPHALGEIFILDESDICEVLLDHGVELCRGCEWWVESHETIDDDLEYHGKCEDCRND